MSTATDSVKPQPSRGLFNKVCCAGREVGQSECCRGMAVTAILVTVILLGLPTVTTLVLY